MFRSLFFAIGIFLLIVGAQTLVVDKWIMSGGGHSALASTGINSNFRDPSRNPYRTAGFANGGTSSQRSYYARNSAVGASRSVFQTREWMPWSLLAAGSILVLYTYSTGRQSVGHES